MTAVITPFIGCWWTECCEEDLVQVTTTEQLVALIERLRPESVVENGPVAGVWATRDDALLKLRDAL